MKWVFLGLLVVHGLVHFLGAAAGLRLANPPQLVEPVSRVLGVVWLLAGVATLVTAGALAASSQHWWVLGLLAIAISQTAIFTSWTDARFGTIANGLLLLGVIYGFASSGPASFRARYLSEVREHFAARTTADASLLAEDDLAPLPAAVRRHIVATGAVGRPRPTHVYARWRGRIRATAGDAWMPFTAEQYDFIDEPSRFFHMSARRGGIPVDVLHRYASGEASMQVRLLSLFPLVDARGSELRQAETVTVLNDLCLLAPAALLDPSVAWEEIDTHRVRARFEAGAHDVSAVLHFDDDGLLVDFVSEDRLAMRDESEPAQWPWSTPVTDYEWYGPTLAARRGAGWWHPPEGSFAYIELELLELEINGPAP